MRAGLDLPCRQQMPQCIHQQWREARQRGVRAEFCLGVPSGTLTGAAQSPGSHLREQQWLHLTTCRVGSAKNWG